MKRKGTFVIIDGIDGSGKGTLVSALVARARKKKLKVFDVVAYEKKHHTLPEPRELKNYWVIRTSEPTHSLIGRAIRQEIIRKNTRDYSGLSTAQAYALDRLILYRRVIIPALMAGKYVFQERGVTTTLAYQPVQAEHLALRTIMQLDGNAQALTWRPDLLVLLKIRPRTALIRLHARTAKQDNAIFETLHFFEKLESRFHSAWYKKIFTSRGSAVRVVDTDGTLQDSRKRLMEVWEEFQRSRG